MMAALGVASRPWLERMASRKVVWIVSHTPLSRQLRKYVHTVDQLGKSWGNALQPHPLRTRYKMALSTSRIFVMRGCPPGLAGGIKGSRMLHSASVRSLG